MELRPSIQKSCYMRYTEYEAEDFILDVSFQNYCLGKDEKDVAFWERWIRDNPQKYNAAEQAKLLYVLLNGNHDAAQFAASRNEFQKAAEQHMAFSMPHTPVTELPASKKAGLRKLFLYGSTAAAAVAAIVFFAIRPAEQIPKGDFSLKYNYTEISKAGERKSFQLPDGSKVMLNAGSTINIAKDFNTHTREISLSGEGFFDVAHNPGKPFVIHTSSMDVKVLGTVFNVKAYPKDKLTETSLIKGSVEIILHNKAAEKILLHPNQKIILPNLNDNNAATTAVKDPPKTNAEDFKITGLTYSKVDSTLTEVSWTENRLVFNESKLDEIAAELERWYNITIRFNDEEVKQYRFTAVFDQKNIVQVLDALQLSRRFEYKIGENNNIIISK